MKKTAVEVIKGENQNENKGENKMSKLNEKLNAIKTGEVKAENKPSGFNPGDVVVLAGEQKGDKLILAGRRAVVTGDSKSLGKVRCILVEKNSNNLQNCEITQLTSSMTKIGNYTDEGEIILDEEAAK